MVRFLLERKKILLALDSIPGRSHGIAVLFDSVFWETSSHPGYRYPARGSGVVVVVFG